MIYSNKEIFEKEIKDEKVKKILDFFDSKGVIILSVDKEIFTTSTKIKILATTKDIVEINVYDNSCFLYVRINNVYKIYIYNSEKPLELLIDCKFDSIIIGELCHESKIDFKSYQEYCKLNSILTQDKYKLYNLKSIINKNKHIVCELIKIKNNIILDNTNKFKYLVLENDNFDEYEEYDDKLPEEFEEESHFNFTDSSIVKYDNF